jgi:UPF0755 protein
MPAQQKSRFRKNLYWLLLILGVLCVAAGIKLYEDVFAGNINLEPNQKDYLHIYSNRSFDENMEALEQTGKLNNTKAFVRLAELTGYATLIKPGRYEVEKGLSNIKLLRMMVAGKQAPIDLVFKYAQRKSDLVTFLCTRLEADSTTLLQLLNDSVNCDTLGFTTDNVIAMFIPNTYNFYWNTSAQKLFKRFNTEYLKFWNEERKAKLNNLNLTPQQVSTLAAIVMKETYRKDEMPVVAGVYLNRLKKGMPLQADPTIIYALNDNTIKRVGGEMLAVESPYNTYKYSGLPPGPICTPNTYAIDAVLNAQQHNYIYFCAKEDFSGYHNFAASFAQHQINARKYQRELSKRGIIK